MIRIISCLLAAALLVAPSALVAADYTGPTGGDYSTPGNWSGAAVPSNTNVNVTNGRSVILAGEAPAITSVEVRSAGSVLEVTTGGTLESTGTINIYDGGNIVTSGTGRFRMGGTNQQFYLGADWTATGLGVHAFSNTAADGKISIDATMAVQLGIYGRNGSLTIDDASDPFTIRRLTFADAGWNNGSTVGTLNLDGGLLTVTEGVSAGGEGYGVINLTNGGWLSVSGGDVNFIGNGDGSQASRLTIDETSRFQVTGTNQMVNIGGPDWTASGQGILRFSNTAQDGFFSLGTSTGIQLGIFGRSGALTIDQFSDPLTIRRLTFADAGWNNSETRGTLNLDGGVLTVTQEFQMGGEGYGVMNVTNGGLFTFSGGSASFISSGDGSRGAELAVDGTSEFRMTAANANVYLGGANWTGADTLRFSNAAQPGFVSLPASTMVQLGYVGRNGSLTIDQTSDPLTLRRINFADSGWNGSDTLGTLNIIGQTVTATQGMQVGGEGYGRINLSEGAILNTASATLLTAGTNQSQLRGAGEFNVTGSLNMQGRVVADGGNLEVTFGSLADGAVPAEATQGWYAVNGGRLTLPQLNVTGSSAVNWGEAPADTTLDLVNSLRFQNWTDVQPGKLEVALTASDTLAGLGLVNPVGLWSMTTSDGLSFSTVDLSLRYDAVASAEFVENLQLWRNDGAGWTAIESAQRDESALTFTATVDSFTNTTFALATDSQGVMRWIASDDGTWSAGPWLGGMGGVTFPTAAAQSIAVIDTPYVVTTDGANSALSLRVSNYGSVDVATGTSLAVAGATTISSPSTLTVRGGGTFSSGTGTISQLNTTGGTATVGAGTSLAVTLWDAGNASGTTLVKTGAGSLNLGAVLGASADTAVTVQGGRLKVAGGTPLGDAGGPVTLDGGTFAVDNATEVTLANPIVVTANGGGLEATTAPVNYGAVTIPNGATLATSGAGRTTVPSTTLGGATAALAPSNVHHVGTYADGGVARTLTIAGSGDGLAFFDNTAGVISAAATQFRVTGGTMEAIGIDPLGGGGVTLAGGTLKLSLAGSAGVALPTGTLAYYDFNQGAATDISGNGNNATLQGNATVTGGALQMNLGGTDGGYAQMPNLAGNFTNAATLSAWVKVDQEYRGFWDFDTNGFNGHYMYGNEMYMPTFRADGRYDAIPKLAGLDTSDWHLLTVVSDPTEGYKVYQNGQQIFHDPNQPTFGIGDFQIGLHNGGGWWGGTTDDFMLVNRGLTATEVAGIYALGRDGLGETVNLAGDLDLRNTPLTVEQNSTLNAVTTGSTLFGALQVNGGVVTAQGSPGGIHFSETTVAAGATGGVNGKVPVTVGPITVGEGGTFVAQGPVTGSGLTLTGASGGVTATDTFNLGSFSDGGSAKTLTVGGAGTKVMNNTSGGFSTANTTLRITGGTLSATGGGGWDALGGATAVQLAGGTLKIATTDTVYANGLQASLYYNTPNSDDWIRFHQSNSALATTPYQTVTTSAAIRYNGDFQNLFPGMPSAENFQAVWTGQFVPAETGNFKFYAEWGDDRELLYIDLNRDGVFTVDERVNGNFDGENRDSGNIALTAGQRYDIAWGFIEYGGGENTLLYYSTPSNPNWRDVHPGHADQLGQWQYTTFQPIALGTKNFLVEADSGLQVTTASPVVAGSLTLADGVLTLGGSAPSFTFADTTVSPTATRVGFSTATLVEPGLITGNGATGMFVKAGTGDMLLDWANTGLEGMTFDVEAGRLVMANSAALGGSTAARLSGGTLLLSSDGSDQAYDVGVTVTANSVLRGARGTPTAANGPLQIDVGSADKMLTVQAGKTLALEAADSYTLSVGNSLILGENSTLDVNSAGVVIDQTGSATLLAAAGSTINLNAGTITTDKPLSVANLKVYGGSLELNGNGLDVASGGQLYVGAAGVNLDFTGSASLTTATNATVEIAAGSIMTDKPLAVGNLTIQSGAALVRMGATEPDRDVSVQTQLALRGQVFDTTGSTLTVGNRIDLRENSQLLYDNPLTTNQLYLDNSRILPGAPLLVTGQIEIRNGSTIDMTGQLFSASQTGTNLYIVNNGSRLTVDNPITVNLLHIEDRGELVAPAGVTVRDRADLRRGTHSFPISGSNGTSSYVRIFGGGVADYANNLDVRLTGMNTYQGRTQIHDATVLVAEDGAGLPTTSTLRFHNGIYGTSGTFARQIGSAEGGLVYWDSYGGFAAYGGDLTVSLATASGGANAPLTWNSGTDGFRSQHLYLGSANATHDVELTNAINFNTTGTIQAHSRTRLATLSGRLTGSGLLDKQGAGTLVLSNADNSGHTGETRITRGVLDVGPDAARLGAGWLRLYADNADNTNRGAILQASGTLAKNIGWTTPGTIGWDSNGGGFAARGGDLTVTLNGGATLNWSGNNTDGFRGTRLMFGSTQADGKVTLTNPINPANGDRYIHVFDNPNSTADYAELSGSLLAGNFVHLRKYGDGRLDLTHVDGVTGDSVRMTHDLYSDNGGRLNIAGNAIVGRNFDIRGASTVAVGGTLNVTRTGGSAWSNLAGGTLEVAGNLTGIMYYNQNTAGARLVVNGDMSVQQHTQMDAGTVTIGGNFSKGAGDQWYIRNGTQVSVAGNATSGHHINVQSQSRLDITGVGKVVAAEGSANSGNFSIYVQGGTLANPTTLAATGASPTNRNTLRGSHVQFHNHALLSGNWTVDTKNYLEFTANARVSPGNGVGEITVTGTGNMFMQNGSSYLWELGAEASDLIRVGNNLSLANTWNLVLGDAGGSSGISDRWTLFTYGGNLTTSLSGTRLTGVNISLAPDVVDGWDITSAQVHVDSTSKEVYLTGLEAIGIPTMQSWQADGVNAGGSGQWNATGSNWRAGTRVSPLNAQAAARFPLPDGVVTIDAAGVSAGGGLVFDPGTQYELAGGTLTLAGAAAAANTVDVQQAAAATISAALAGTAGLTKAGLGDLTLSGGGSLSGPVTVSQGSLRLGHAGALANATVTVAGGTLATSLTTALTGLDVENGRVLLDSAETHAVEVGSFAIDHQAGGLVDLGVGRLEIAAGADATALREALAAGGAATGWNGTAGVLSTAAAATGGSRTVGYLVGSDGSGVLAFAAPGDTNLDGLVDTLDLVTMASSGKYGTGQAAVWADGDFNYDGQVDSLDLVTMASLGVYGAGNYLPLPTAPAVTAVPEPGSVALLLVALAGGAGLAARRRGSGPSHAVEKIDRS